MDFLSKTISNIKGFRHPYSIGDEIPNNPEYPSIWSINEATSKV